MSNYTTPEQFEARAAEMRERMFKQFGGKPGRARAAIMRGIENRAKKEREQRRHENRVFSDRRVNLRGPQQGYNSETPLFFAELNSIVKAVSGYRNRTKPRHY